MRLRQARGSRAPRLPTGCSGDGLGDVPQGHHCAKSCRPLMWLVPMQVRRDRHALASRILLSVIDFLERQFHTALICAVAAPNSWPSESRRASCSVAPRAAWWASRSALVGRRFSNARPGGGSVAELMLLGSPSGRGRVAIARIVIVGAGVVGLGAALLLCGDGHEVTILERDAEAPPAGAEEIWGTWQRKGVNQFRLPHFFLARYRGLLDSELPEVKKGLVAAGAVRLNPVLDAPETIRGSAREEDGACDCISGRRR